MQAADRQSSKVRLGPLASRKSQPQPDRPWHPVLRNPAPILRRNRRQRRVIPQNLVSAVLPNQYSKMLFDCASTLTYNMRSIAKSQHAMNLSEGARGFVFNGDMVLVIQALDIGTRPSNLR